MQGPPPTDWRSVALPGTTALIAVSGGADSVFLLHWFRENVPGVHLVVGHVNHGLRGAESDADESFVANLAKELSLPFIRRSIHTERSDEDSLRDARLASLAHMMDDARADYLVLGHHSNDLSEWFLLAALRGSGPRGLGGMVPVSYRGTRIILRPLLDWKRATIRQWLEARSLRWREDSSNQSDLYRRNRIRNEVLPLLDSISPGAAASITDAAELCRRTARVYERACREWLRPGLIASPASGSALLDRSRCAQEVDLDLLPGILREFVRYAVGGAEVNLRRSVAEAAAENVVMNRDEEVRYLVADLQLVLTRRYWLAHRGNEVKAWKWYRAELPFLFGFSDELSINLDGKEVHTPAGTIAIVANPDRPLGPLEIVLDRASLRGTLRLTPVASTERIGIGNGHKTVADCLRDAEVPVPLRPMAWGLRDDEGIVWLPGVRQDSRTLYRQGSGGVGLRLIRRE